jgi:cytochrome c-type protein NapB
MNGKRVVILTLALACVAYGGQLFSQENVATMRGTTAIDETSLTPENKPWAGKTDPIARDFVEQPPLIPHKSQSYKINMEGNKCLSCHGVDTYEKKKATLVSETHFKDRDGKQLDNVSASRYSCTQCHVEQRVAEPLVGNEYQSAKILK